VVTGRLNQLFALADLTERGLAKKAGLPPTTVQNVLRGKSDLPLGLLIRLVHAFDLRSVEELIAPLGTSQLRREEFGVTVRP
jgi:plasmid maintenance system antidote protein VapI